MKRIVWIPIALFLVLLGFLAVGLNKDPHSIPSPLIDKPAPAFRVSQLDDAGKSFSPEAMRGKVWMLNVWASWCVSCREEHPVLVAFSRTNTVPLVGLDYKDQPADANRWLAQFGNPYSLVAVDADGRVGIDYGVYGVPETYVIDRNGVIRFKQIGPVTQEVLDQTILPLIKKLSS